MYGPVDLVFYTHFLAFSQGVWKKIYLNIKFVCKLCFSSIVNIVLTGHTPCLMFGNSLECAQWHMLSSVFCYFLFETLEGAYMLRSNRLDFETTSSKCYVMGMNKHMLRSADFLAVFFHIFHFDIWHETNKDPNIIKLRRENFDHKHPCCRLLLPLVSSYECECGGISLNANKEWASLKKKWNKSPLPKAPKRGELVWGDLVWMHWIFRPTFCLDLVLLSKVLLLASIQTEFWIYNSSILLSMSIYCIGK